MFKRAFGMVAALAFVLGLAPQTSNIAEKISGTCSYVCCEHDGDLWDW